MGGTGAAHGDDVPSGVERERGNPPPVCGKAELIAAMVRRVSLVAGYWNNPNALKLPFGLELRATA